MFIKICGITRAEDAHVAVDHGADALGFIFWRASPRFIEPARAREIIATLPDTVLAVGVFVNQPSAEVNEMAGQAGLSVIQAHGDETAAYLRELTRPVIKAVAVTGIDSASIDWPDEVTLLVDAQDRVRRGGTGQRADWAAAGALARRRRVLLAGGLTPENVAEAITVVRPFGIDVSSGVERSPGVKDRQRIAALFDAVAASALGRESGFAAKAENGLDGERGPGLARK